MFETRIGLIFRLNLLDKYASCFCSINSTGNIECLRGNTNPFFFFNAVLKSKLQAYNSTVMWWFTMSAKDHSKRQKKHIKSIRAGPETDKSFYGGGIGCKKSIIVVGKLWTDFPFLYLKKT